MAAPLFKSAVTNTAGTQITLTFDQALDAASVPHTGLFTVSGRAVTKVAIARDTVTLTVSKAIVRGDVITVGYKNPLDGNEQTFDLPASAYSTDQFSTGRVRWTLAAGARPAVNAALTGGPARFLSWCRARGNGTIELNFADTISGATRSGADLSNTFEQSGQVIFTSGAVSVAVSMAGADPTEPYSFRASNQAEVKAFVDALRNRAGNQAGTLTLRDFVPGSPPLQNAGGEGVATFAGSAVRNTVPTPLDASAPAAEINAVPNGYEGATVQLGATLKDGNYDTLEYKWTVNGGTLDDSASATPTWTRPDVASDRDFTITLALTARGTGTKAFGGTRATSSATRTARVWNIVPNVPPTIIIATAPQTIDRGATLALAATVADRDGVVDTILWTADGGTFADAGIEDASWTAPKPENETVYTLTCTVTDDDGAQASDTVQITVKGRPRIPPVSTIDTPAQTIDAQARLELEASDSDERTIVSRKWSATGGAFEDETVQDAVWIAPGPEVQTDYVLTYTVTDDDGLSTSASVRITVRRLAALQRYHVETRKLEGDEPVYALEITHKLLPEPIRVVAANKPISLEGSEYTPLGFQAVPPQFVEGETPTASLEIDNVGHEIMEWVEASDGGRGAFMRIMRAVRPPTGLVADSAIVWEMPRMAVGVTAATMQRIRVTVLQRTGRIRPAIKLRFDPVTSPGLF